MVSQDVTNCINCCLLNWPLSGGVRAVVYAFCAKGHPTLTALPSASDASDALSGAVLLVYGRETQAT
jgi:hypothetical protein